MNFRLHWMVVTTAILVFTVGLFAQQQPPAQNPATPPASQEEGAQLPQEKTPEAPIKPVIGGAYPVMSKAAEARAREIFEMFNHGESSRMWASLSEGLKKVSGKEERFTAINKKYHEALGPESTMMEENFVPYLFAPDTVYSRMSRYANVRRPVPIVVSITINQRGEIDAFDIKAIPERVAEGRFAGYQDTAKLKLPFNGEWLVYQGGRTPFQNPYAFTDDQRFGMDFAYLKNGRLFSGAGGVGSKNEDYYCFGQPVLAPFDGTVSKAEQGYDDNPPGKPSGDPPDGNLVAILHEEGDAHETAMMNHLKQNSLKVKRGDKVKQGEVLAECGNSGAGPVPHLHFQLQKSPGTPIPAQFTDYIADGKPVASGEPVRGQFVKNGAATAAGAVTTSSGNATIMTSTPAAGSTSTPPAQKPSH